MIQYERRFVELYELVAEKLIETRKYYALYNTLDESHKATQNEVSLLESIVEGFPKAVKTKQGREMFLQSFAETVSNLDKNVTQMQGSVQKERESLEL